MASPTPKPTAIRILEGNAGKKPINENEPKPKPIAPRMPWNLPKAAQRFWRDVEPKLTKLGVMTEVDGYALEQAAMQYALAKEAGLVLAKEGLTHVDDKGVTRKHPMTTVFFAASTQFRHWCGELGLTPAQRTKLSVPEPESDDGFFGF